MAAKKSPEIHWTCKAGKNGANWRFSPNKKARKEWPDCESEGTGSFCEPCDVVSLVPLKTEGRDKTLVISTDYGTIELLDFDTDWRELNAIPPENIIWDIGYILNDWGND